MSILPSACVASVWKSAPAACAARASSATGCTLPTSPFAICTDTSTVSPSSASSRARGSTKPCASGARRRTRKPSRSRARAGASTASCSMAVVTTCGERAGRPARRRASSAARARPRRAALSASVAPDVNTISLAREACRSAAIERRAPSSAAKGGAAGRVQRVGVRARRHVRAPGREVRLHCARGLLAKWRGGRPVKVHVLPGGKLLHAPRPPRPAGPGAPAGTPRPAAAPCASAPEGTPAPRSARDALAGGTCAVAAVLRGGLPRIRSGGKRPLAGGVADGGYLGQRAGGVGRAEHGVAAHQHVGPRRRHARRRLRADAAVHLQKGARARLAGKLRHAHDARLASLDVALPGKARLHAHDQHHVNAGEEGGERLGRRGGLDAQGRPRARLPREAKRGMHVLGRIERLHVQRHRVRAGIQEPRQLHERVVDHQVHVEGQRRGALEALDHGTPMDRFGTKCPSITSTCTMPAPASSTSRTSRPSFAKSAERIDGAICSGSNMPSRLPKRAKPVLLHAGGPRMRAPPAAAGPKTPLRHPPHALAPLRHPPRAPRMRARLRPCLHSSASGPRRHPAGARACQ